MQRLRTERIGEENYNKFGSLMIIKDYRKYNDIDVYFPEYDWVYKNTTYDGFKKSQLRCPYEPTSYGVGYIGEGEFVTSINHESTRVYDVWHHMLERCYSDIQDRKYPSYKGCWVCDEWHNFQNFARWYNDNYYELDGERMNLDKDILYKGNMLYSPETCIITPQSINSLFIKSDIVRGSYPIGVNYDKRYKTYNSHCNDHGELIWLGSYKTVEEAFIAYKTYKENLIKRVADEYKGLIPDVLYQAMYKYNVEIDD